MRLRDTGAPRPAARTLVGHPLRRGETYVNVGFCPPSRRRRATRDEPVIEATVDAHDGHKSLYSDSFYDPETFARLYGGTEAARLAARYDPEGRLLDLYSKAVRRR